MIAFKCEACGKGIKAADGMAGQSASCPTCKARVTVPTGNAVIDAATRAAVSQPVADSDSDLLLEIVSKPTSARLPGLAHACAFLSLLCWIGAGVGSVAALLIARTETMQHAMIAVAFVAGCLWWGFIAKLAAAVLIGIHEGLVSLRQIVATSQTPPLAAGPSTPPP